MREFSSLRGRSDEATQAYSRRERIVSLALAMTRSNGYRAGDT